MKAETNNLYNLSRNKTRTVMQYIYDLMPTPQMTKEETRLFNETKHKALLQQSANAMLEMIGYEPKGTDKIYFKSMLKRK